MQSAASTQLQLAPASGACRPRRRSRRANPQHLKLSAAQNGCTGTRLHRLRAGLSPRRALRAAVTHVTPSTLPSLAQSEHGLPQPGGAFGAARRIRRIAGDRFAVRRCAEGGWEARCGWPCGGAADTGETRKIRPWAAAAAPSLQWQRFAASVHVPCERCVLGCRRARTPFFPPSQRCCCRHPQHSRHPSRSRRPICALPSYSTPADFSGPPFSLLFRLHTRSLWPSPRRPPPPPRWSTPTPACPRTPRWRCGAPSRCSTSPYRRSRRARGAKGVEVALFE